MEKGEETGGDSPLLGVRMSEDLIAEGRRLIEAATPWPLEVDAIDPYDVITRHYEPVAEHESRAGATLHVFAVNNLAALLDVVEAAARNSWAREEYGLASGASHTEPGSICETCERTKDAAQAVLDSEDALDSALSKLRVSRAS